MPVVLTPAAGAQGAILGRGTPQGSVFTIPSPGYRTTALPQKDCCHKLQTGERVNASPSFLHCYSIHY